MGGNKPTEWILLGRKQVITGMLLRREQGGQWEGQGREAKQGGGTGAKAERPLGCSPISKLLNEATRGIKNPN